MKINHKFQLIKNSFIFRRTLWDMTLRQFKLKYAGSHLGIWWSIITPLILALSINFVFSMAFKINTPNYTLFVLAGIVPWLFFTNAITEAANSFIINSSILKQNLFPREFVPISFILANLLNFLVGFIFLLPLFIILNFKVINFLPFLAFTIMLHLIFIIGLGVLFSIINVFFRDLSHFLSIAFMIWFWATPIFYSLDMLTFPSKWICLLNPMSHYVALYRGLLLEAKMPPLTEIVIVSLISLASLLLGYFVFSKSEPALLKRI